MDFLEYREIFYFLQYQYYIRSNRHEAEQPLIQKALTSKSAQLPIHFDFLTKLVQRPEDIHLKWELEGRQTVLNSRRSEIKRVPRGVKKVEFVGKLPVTPNHFPRIYFSDLPRLPEDAYNYMVFNFPKEHRVNQIASIYKSLLVLDAVRDGCEMISIADNVLSRKLTSLTPFRKLSLFEWIGCVRYPAEEKLLKYCPPFFSATVRQADKKEQQLFNTKKEIERYYERANILLSLAESGRFKQYPHYLKN